MSRGYAPGAETRAALRACGLWYRRLWGAFECMPQFAPERASCVRRLLCVSALNVCVVCAWVRIKVCPEDYDGASPAEVVLGPLMDQNRTEWMVPTEAEGDIVEETDLLGCAKRHRDFFKHDLYVTQQSIVKFLDVELRMPQKKKVGAQAKSFVFTAKHLRKRLDEEGYTAKAIKAGKDGKGKQGAKNPLGAAM